MADVILSEAMDLPLSIRIFLSYAFDFIPKLGGHSWIELFGAIGNNPYETSK